MKLRSALADVVGGLLLTGRLLHGYAFSFAEQFMIGRVIGMVLVLSALSLAVMPGLWRALMT